MRFIILSFIALLSVVGLPYSVTADENEGATLIKAGRVLDGRGNVLGAKDILIKGGRIAAILPQGTGKGDHVLDWSRHTVMPGLIDTHVHLGWHFGPDGRWSLNSSAEDHVLYATENAYAMLKAGVTTVQSLGGDEDGPVRDAINRGIIPGPRILTSLSPLTTRTGDAAAMRARVKELAEKGADVIKVFGSESIRTGGAPNLTQEQLNAACGEANAQGLRAVVHAHGPEAARRASEAGCWSIEHGALLDRETLQLLAKNGTYYAPHTHLIFQNYFDNQDRYQGIGNFTLVGFAGLRQAVPKSLAAFKAALTVPDLKILYGTDAVAGAHGRNVEELIYRVRTGGQKPMDALVSANILAAESLNLANETGAISVGLAADIIAINGNPDENIETLSNVHAVMIGGKIGWQR